MRWLTAAIPKTELWKDKNMWQPVFMVSGFFMSIMGLAMLIPAALDIYDTGSRWSYFLNSSIIALFLGFS